MFDTLCKSSGIVFFLCMVLLPGCDEYNRADISDDGKFIAFSYGKKGFVTDDSSEMYLFDVENCRLQRLTVNSQCDAWADLNGRHDLVYLQVMGDGYGLVAVCDGGTVPMPLARLFANAPLWLDDDLLFFSAAYPQENDTDKLNIVFYLYDSERLRLEKLVEIPYRQGETTPFSTLPTFNEKKKLYPGDAVPFRRRIRIQEGRRLARRVRGSGGLRRRQAVDLLLPAGRRHFREGL